MNEKELHKVIKQSVRSTSLDFTDKVMDTILQQSQAELIQARKIRFLSIACLVIIVLSLFVVLPDFSYLHYTLRFSPVVIPVFSVFFLLFELQQLRDLKQKIALFNRG